MNGNLTLGHLGGVEIRINWSWLVVFALIVWSLAATVFPSQNPELSDGVHLAMGVAAALAFRDAMMPLDRVPVLAADARAVDALADLSSRPAANRGLVVDDGRLEGLLSITDLARALQARRPPRPVRSRPVLLPGGRDD